MSDFLTRLAKRTLGLAPTVQPVIASIFAPGPTIVNDLTLDLWREEVAPGDAEGFPTPVAREARPTYPRPDAMPSMARRDEPSSPVPDPPRSNAPVAQPLSTYRVEVDLSTPVGHQPSHEAPESVDRNPSAPLRRPDHLENLRTGSRSADRDRPRAGSPAAAARPEPAQGAPRRPAPSSDGEGSPTKPRADADPTAPVSREFPKAPSDITPGPDAPPSQTIHPQITASPHALETLGPEPPRTQEVSDPRTSTRRSVAPISVSPKARRLEQEGLNPADQRLSSPGPPSPIIQVSIGRIEVRATPPPVLRPPKQPSASPVMGLDEYLRRRTKGGDR